MFNDHTFALSTRPRARPRRSFGDFSPFSLSVHANYRQTIAIYRHFTRPTWLQNNLFLDPLTPLEHYADQLKRVFTANPLTTPARPDHWLRSITLLARRPNLFGNGRTRRAPSLNDAISCWKPHDASCQGGGGITRLSTEQTSLEFRSKAFQSVFYEFGCIDSTIIV